MTVIISKPDYDHAIPYRVQIDEEGGAAAVSFKKAFHYANK
jgi:hypothetical protein